MNDLMEMLRGTRGDEDEDRVKILPEAAIMQLRGIARLYADPISFKVGDIVTPRIGSNIRGAGSPEIVIEVLPEAGPMFSGEQGTPEFGKHYNLRVLSLKRDHTVPFWVEAAQYEIYNGPGLDP